MMKKKNKIDKESIEFSDEFEKEDRDINKKRKKKHIKIRNNNERSKENKDYSNIPEDPTSPSKNSILFIYRKNE